MTTGLGSTSAGLTVTAVKDGGKKLMSSISLKELLMNCYNYRQIFIHVYKCRRMDAGSRGSGVGRWWPLLHRRI